MYGIARAGADGSLLTDALRPPFRGEAFGVVVTPWLLDVVEAPPADVVQRINPLLCPGGLWINHGSVAFDRFLT